jgi:uncharacterized protein (DUF433 family)
MHGIASDAAGQPVIAGTHVTVEEVLKELAAWGEVGRVLMTHPELDREAVQAVLELAAEKVHDTEAPCRHLLSGGRAFCSTDGFWQRAPRTKKKGP